MARLAQNNIDKKTINELFIYDDGVLRWKNNRANNKVKAGDIAGCLNDKGYYHLTINRKRYKNHRLIWILHNGDIEEGYTIDHINGNRIDNRICNLRVLSMKLNSWNRTTAKGCNYDKSKCKWRTSIRRNGKAIHLGFFNNEEDAHNAYKIAQCTLMEHKGYLIGIESDVERTGGFGSTGGIR